MDQHSETKSRRTRTWGHQEGTPHCVFKQPKYCVERSIDGKYVRNAEDKNCQVTNMCFPIPSDSYQEYQSRFEFKNDKIGELLNASSEDGGENSTQSFSSLLQLPSEDDESNSSVVRPQFCNFSDGGFHHGETTSEVSIHTAYSESGGVDDVNLPSKLQTEFILRDGYDYNVDLPSNLQLEYFLKDGASTTRSFL